MHSAGVPARSKVTPYPLAPRAHSAPCLRQPRAPASTFPGKTRLRQRAGPLLPSQQHKYPGAGLRATARKGRVGPVRAGRGHRGSGSNVGAMAPFTFLCLCRARLAARVLLTGLVSELFMNCSKSSTLRWSTTLSRSESWSAFLGCSSFLLVSRKRSFSLISA